MNPTTSFSLPFAGSSRPGVSTHRDDLEARRDARYPISRWWLRPLAVRLAGRLAETSLRPGHFTLLNLIFVAAAVAVLLASPNWSLLSAVLVLAGWFCDRLDGALARSQGRQSATGAWLDGNIDELGDLALHGAMAAVAAVSLGGTAWGLFMGFLAGKYLLMYGLQSPEGAVPAREASAKLARHASLLHALYHFPANADVRIHFAMAALIAAAWNPDWLAVELALIAVYYNLRWITRYALVLFRLRSQISDLKSP